MEELLSLRWNDRNRILSEEFLSVRERMNGRGMLPSSIAVKEFHEVARKEFEASRGIIVDTIVDSIRQKEIKLDRQLLDRAAKERLAERRDQLDALFSQNARVTIDSLQNQTMIQPYMSVAQYFDHAVGEISIELTRALDEYESTLGQTLKDRIVNRFLNNPAIAVIVIVVLALTTILGLFALMRGV